MKLNKWIIAAMVAGTATFSACSKEARIDDEPGIGGAGTEGDSDIGENEGVLDDGEGPLEEDGVGDNEGVWNDGEGPIEERSDDDAVFGDNPGVRDDGEGPIEDAEDENVGENPGVMDDGEGPLEENPQ